jgi:low molecular weight protein-tyrosine phosphatase
MVRLCFVCLGNICRSPTAEAVMFDLVKKAGLESKIEVDSAGTAGYHAGERPDARAAAAARRRGIELRGRARQFKAQDYERFDYVLAMDRSNFEDLTELARTEAARKKLHLLRSFDAQAFTGAGVPDPYYGGEDGFEQVLDICTAACTGLLLRVKKDHGL